MSKRGATSELNRDNWNDEEEPEEAGTWKQAPSEAIKGRVFKQARRRLAADGQDEVWLISTNNVFLFENFVQNSW